VLSRYIEDLYRQRCDADMRDCYGISTGGDAKDKVGCLFLVPVARYLKWVLSLPVAL
jgi:hypothetical protein